MNGSNLHVVPKGFWWAVKKEGTGKASRVFSNKWIAADYALHKAKKSHDCVIAHERNGRIKSVEC